MSKQRSTIAVLLAASLVTAALAASHYLSSSSTEPTGSATNVSVEGCQDWLDPSYAEQLDKKVTSSITHCSGNLVANDFGFSIPDDATITAAEVTYTGYQKTPADEKSLDDFSIALVGESGTNLGIYKAGADFIGPKGPGGQEVTATYPGDELSDWGLSTLSVDNVNSTDFGVTLNLHYVSTLADSVYIDYITMTITYTTSGRTAERQTRTARVIR
jgi:hypothetical protein